MLLMKDGKVKSAQARISTSQLYTLAEIEQLAHQFVGKADTDNYERRLLFSVFISWLQQQEREGSE